MGYEDFRRRRMIIILTPNRFRWVFCQLEALRHCLPPSVRRVLDELPDTLDVTYERILKDINKAKREHAHRLLQCLVVAVRPLRIAELGEVLAVDFGTTSGRETSKLNPDWRWEDQEQAVLSTCSSLITVVGEDEDQVVQFSHFSVKEFLTSPRLADSSPDVSRFHIPLGPAHVILARACLGTLLRFDDDIDQYSVDYNFPLGRYAAEHWVKHAQFEDVSSQLREEMEILFDQDRPYFSAWVRVHDHDINIDVQQTNQDTNSGTTVQLYANYSCQPAPPLYYAALCGFHNLAEHLVHKCSQKVDVRGGRCISPLSVALGRGHFKTAQLLYEHGADIDVQSAGRWTLLHASSVSGQIEVVQWLLSHGADPNSREDDDWTPLLLAANNGRLEIVRMLLQHNADINTRSNDDQTPLHRASQKWDSDVAQLLLEYGSEINARDKNGSTPLHLASQNQSPPEGLCPKLKDGRFEVARLLIERGADVRAEDNKGKTPFQVASESDMVKLLSDLGAE